MDIHLPGIHLKATSADASVIFEPFGSSHYTKPICPVEQTFRCDYHTAKDFHPKGLKVVLSGESFEDIEIPYRWQILRDGKHTGILIDFFDDPQFQKAGGIIDFQNHIIGVTLVPHKNATHPVANDPLFQPFGSILMVVLAHHAGDIIIHASGVKDQNTGRLFTAVSGTGKSTMAGIWKEAGAEVINDDRLWLHKEKGQWTIFNTPMPYYAQRPLKGPLHEIFLLRQSPENEIRKLSGANAAMRFMANGIQHFYDKNMTGQHLDQVMDIALSTIVATIIPYTMRTAGQEALCIRNSRFS